MASTHYDGRWGTLNDRERVADGIDWIDGSSHGGFVLSAARMAAMPEDLRRDSFTQDNYFEEDCAAAAVVVAFPECFAPAKVERAAGFRAAYRARATAIGGARRADYDARHGVRADGLPPSDADPETGVQYGEVA